MKKSSWILDSFISISGFLGSFFAFYTPIHEAAHLSVDILKNSPFQSFFFPGVYLFLVIGVGNLFCVYLLKKENTGIGFYLQALLGIFLLLWLIVQGLFLRGIAIPHIIYAVLAMGQILFAIRTIKKEHYFFPFSAKQN
ncbi:hypothetical protein ACYSNW_16495 [Enterococcus sp. LJL99]